MIQAIIDENTDFNKEKLIIKSLQELIKQDKRNNDIKSLNYHTLALKEHQKYLKSIETERSEEYGNYLIK